MLCNGTTQAKLEWAYQMFDINGDGKIQRDEMKRVIEVGDSMAQGRGMGMA